MLGHESALPQGAVQFRQSLAKFPRPLVVRFPVPRALQQDITAVFIAPMPRTAQEAVAAEEQRARRARLASGAPPTRTGTSAPDHTADAAAVVGTELAGVARYLQASHGLPRADDAPVRVTPRVSLPASAKSKAPPASAKARAQTQAQARANKVHGRAVANANKAGAGGSGAAGTAEEAVRREAAKAPPVRVAQRASHSGGRFDVYMADEHGTTLFFSSRAGVAAKGELRVTAAAIERHHILGLSRPPRLLPLPPPLAQAEAAATRARGGKPGADAEEICGVLEFEVARVTTTYQAGDPYGEPSSSITFRAREVDFLLRSVIFGVHLPAPVPPVYAHAVERSLTAVAKSDNSGSKADKTATESEDDRRRALAGRLCMALYGQGANVASTRSPLRHPVVAAEELGSVELAVLYGDPRELFPKETTRIATEEQLEMVMASLKGDAAKDVVTDSAMNAPPGMPTETEGAAASNTSADASAEDAEEAEAADAAATPTQSATQ